MSRTVPPIPPPFGTTSGNTGSPNPNRVDTMPTNETINTTTTPNNEKGNSEKVLIAESFDWDEESVSSKNEGTTKIRASIAFAEDEPYVGKADARSSQWVDITMKKLHRLLSITDGDEKKHVLDYTHVDLHYVEDQRKNFLNKFNLFKQELSLHKFEVCLESKEMKEYYFVVERDAWLRGESGFDIGVSEFTLSSLDVLQGFSFFLQMGLTLILATLDGLDVGLLGDVIGEDDCDDDG
uniref:Retrovirus-related Pol polyprotein from transposon TNT 1-94 n=1 Tax=Tanacetum cinerariifolium TaxID=118510 RepID=A0A6L2KI66_TANCI|nr:hypothetical protein [Tanacetum cinerariifolium]